MSAWAENEGEEDLDKATDLKISAKTFSDLGEVINLCRSALAEGLDADHQQFANNLLKGTLAQRAQVISEQIFSRQPDRWPLLRQQALLDVEEALRIDPKQAELHILAAKLQALPGGNRKEAQQSLDTAIDLLKDDPREHSRALILRGTLSKDLVKRRADYDEAIKIAPKEVEPWRTRGLLSLGENKLDAALADLDQALTLDPKQADLHESRGLALFMQKKYDEALQSFDKALELAPKAAVLHTHRARVFALKNELDKALADLQKALELDPKLAFAFTMRARIQLAKKDTKAALEDVTEALRLAPGEPDALQLHAGLVAGKGMFEEAIADLQQLRRREPHNAQVLMQLGTFYEIDKQPRKAIEVFTSIIERDPQNWQAYRSRGDAMLNLGRQAEAIADYDAALKIEKKDSGLLNNLAWVLATSPDAALRNGKRAIELATTACEVTEYKQPHILSTLAAGYAEAGDFAKAVEWSKKAAALQPETVRDVSEQLAKELKSYESGKPWRELLNEEAVSQDPPPKQRPQPEPVRQPEDSEAESK